MILDLETHREVRLCIMMYGQTEWVWPPNSDEGGKEVQVCSTGPLTLNLRKFHAEESTLMEEEV